MFDEGRAGPLDPRPKLFSPSHAHTPHVEDGGADAGGGGGGWFYLWAALQPVDIDPEVAALHRKLGEINQRLMRGDLVDNSIPEWERSPSPEPTYDRMGNRTNTREVRAREKMQQQRIEVIEELIAKCPTYRCVSPSRPLPLYPLALTREPLHRAASEHLLPSHGSRCWEAAQWSGSMEQKPTNDD
jgi:hypothetical protein